ncbi:hypothetical protein EDB85DRAFT_1975125 [Lactarius pseudohatsudake]|nr:hypothetical protein EDB85DRAFT_1975125 [Lactarius pseudohatsudake]
MLECESRTGRDWIACTTDAVFLEKPQYYDLIDLTSYAPTKRRARPGLQLAIQEPYAPRPTYRLSTIRFTWSNVRLVQTASRARTEHRPRSERGRTRGACTRTYASSARGSSPAYGAAAIVTAAVDRATH